MEKTFSKYSKVFDETSNMYSNDMEQNLMFIKYVRKHADDLLKVRKTIFLNDVYNMLGFSRTQYGQIVGWHYDLDNPIGNNCIDFDIHMGDIKNTGRIIIDFNVDGKVIQYLPE